MNEYKIFPLGDSAITIHFGNYISEALSQKVIAMHRWLQQNPFDGLKDVIIAYSSLSVLYDAPRVKSTYKPEKTVFDFIHQKLEGAYKQSVVRERDHIVKRIPVCYDKSLGFDLDYVASENQLSTDEVVSLHTDGNYRVYMIGFQPGFPYMAKTDERITISRKERQRALVPAGSVGLAGIQTGIYTVDSPGGWQIIGRTPIKLFNKNKPNSLIIKPGDLIQFYAVPIKEFLRLSDTRS